MCNRYVIDMQSGCERICSTYIIFHAIAPLLHFHTAHLEVNNHAGLSAKVRYSIHIMHKFCCQLQKSRQYSKTLYEYSKALYRI